ncbi:IS6-like element ISHbo1 family transposase [Halogeometricum borinquense]|uniref:Transposase n=1 Tax=Halogeometricum borinquense (strain ATCC 700274 / DSM 11551 / JCM 10706 / KCTC 4070 / PR3) TaxID=469382 RepID=E4NUV9_HALBP|nr:IS6-like element ISHbo1 family transposase [Halogeometricum borinquense]ADQ68948.1 transposase [Halogeometricum borinquense DSM 11551]
MLADLLSECFETDYEETWERERTATPVRVFAVQLHATGCSLRETKEILRILGVERSHQAVWQWVHRLADSGHNPPEATPKRVAVDETAVKINGEWSWLYAAIDIETKLILDVELFGRHGTDPAAAFLHRLSEKHDLSDAVFLVDGYGYQTALSRLGLSGRLDYVERNLIEKWFHTLKMRVDRFHNSWVGSHGSIREWFIQFAQYYNFQRPHQSLNGRTPVEEVTN